MGARSPSVTGLPSLFTLHVCTPVGERTKYREEEKGGWRREGSDKEEGDRAGRRQGGVSVPSLMTEQVKEA